MSAECNECSSDLVGSQYDERGLWCLSCTYKHQLAEAQEKLEAVKEQVAYGFTGETLKNLHEGMSAREMNEWWRKTLDRILFEEDDEKGTCPTCHQPRIKYDAEGFPTNGY